jgi:aerobic carbon-monoxide dehydrogenase small subunit
VAKKLHVTTTINGEAVEFLCEARQSLLEVLRDTLGLTGAKEGCNNGNCGACTVIVDGVPVDSCLVLAAEAQGAQISTIEGIARESHLHPIQQCFLEGAALQCGVCTPGFIMSAKALLDSNPNPSEHEIRFQLAGNLCRCTGYDKIVRAVQDSARVMAASGHRGSAEAAHTNGASAKQSQSQPR